MYLVVDWKSTRLHLFISALDYLVPLVACNRDDVIFYSLIGTPYSWKLHRAFVTGCVLSHATPGHFKHRCCFQFQLAVLYQSSSHYPGIALLQYRPLELRKQYAKAVSTKAFASEVHSNIRWRFSSNIKEEPLMNSGPLTYEQDFGVWVEVLHPFSSILSVSR